jgi:integrase
MGKQAQNSADELDGKLTVARVKELVRAGAPGMHGDGANLWLRITRTGSSNWCLRYTAPNGKAREMGLGSTADYNLAEARARARGHRKIVHEGGDPLVKRDNDKPSAAHAFKDVAVLYIEAHRKEWRNTKHADQWSATLTQYAYPVIGEKDVAAVTTEDVLAILKPHWETRTETMTRVRSRVEAVLGYAGALDWRSKINPASWQGMKPLLPAKAKITKVKHHAAVNYRVLPDFMTALEAKSAISALCLRFVVLCAARSGEARNATWNQINLDHVVTIKVGDDEYDIAPPSWIIPAESMKADKIHAVPLSSQALAVLAQMRKFQTSKTSHIFPGQVKDKPLSDVALNKMIPNAATVHGMRSSFSTWCADKTTYPREVREAALAHTLGSKVEIAYQRSSLFDLRVPLMQQWADYVAPVSA